MSHRLEITKVFFLQEMKYMPFQSSQKNQKANRPKDWHLNPFTKNKTAKRNDTNHCIELRVDLLFRCKYSAISAATWT